MIIFKGGVISGPYPALFLKEKRALVIADLHIGYESSLKDKGIHIPQNSYPYMRSVIDSLLRLTGAKTLIMLGDVKHEFGKPSAQEWVEVKDLLSFLSDGGIEVHVVRGNHDNYIIAILNRMNVPLHDPFMVMEDILLMHGHKEVEVPEDIRVILMGHEHPAVSSRDLSGSRYKFKCFLVGRIGKERKRIVVLPSMSPLTLGVGINETPKEELLSPLLRSVDVDSLTPVVVEEQVGVFRFPQVGLMRSVIKMP
ncbi:MAG: metallophosphoesterase [Candidatus Methanomethyliaceae archaeon]|nr:metallophosphoesterase [Candidatus Methanomethyliaceae archaeon]